MQAAVATISDRCSRGETTDTSGPALVEMLQEQLDAAVVQTACVPDDRALISRQLITWSECKPTIDLVLTTGGTGLAPRDVTPEATADVLEREHSGLMELVRMRCYAKTPRAYLSRGIAGVCGRTLIINLPGSQRGATESLEALLDILPHAIETLRGNVVDDGRGRIIRQVDST
ncbi:MogA/MoaB family molybdenum cofactor biosynthesis protein [Planctomycetales bacterium ZRK34]|nr:MogA/MoaB family molybdenum cofactor biosynthesis protein [Planctomycetales bacterium ZRK34]